MSSPVILSKTEQLETFLALSKKKNEKQQEQIKRLIEEFSKFKCSCDAESDRDTTEIKRLNNLLEEAIHCMADAQGHHMRMDNYVKNAWASIERFRKEIP